MMGFFTFVTLHCITVSAFIFYLFFSICLFVFFSDYYCYIIVKLYGRPEMMSVCSSGSPPLVFIWFSLYVIHLANKSSSSSTIAKL